MKYIVLSAFAGLLACSPATNAAPAPGDPATSGAELIGNWIVVPSESSIQFTATQTGDTFTGAFKTFDAVIDFDPDNLADASVTARVNMGSVDAGDDERNGALPSKDWFFVKSHPVAVFTSTDFETAGENAYVANGTLEMRGITQPVSLPFILDITDDRADMHGSVTLNRSDFKVGQGAWATEEWVGFDVKVDVKVMATRR